VVYGNLVGNCEIEEDAKKMRHFCYLQAEIETFNPIKYFTAEELIKRWTSKLVSKGKAIMMIYDYAHTDIEREDPFPILRNYYYGALVTDKTDKRCPLSMGKFDPLKGVYLESDIIAVEKHCHFLEHDQGSQVVGSVEQKLSELESVLQGVSVRDDSAINQFCGETQTESEFSAWTVNSDSDEKLASLFDGVTVECLAKMFPTDKDESIATKKWKNWQNNAKENDLIEARQGRGIFNPYKAGIWFLKKKIQGWDTARLHRTLAKNLPVRSRDEKHLLTGELN